MSEIQEKPADSASHWLLVLCLVGLDYFSTLAYLPSLAVAAAGSLAPLAAVAVVLVTIFLALPVYMYVAGRSSGGRGAAGLLENVIPGWRGKVLVLTLLGFAAADFVVTRSLSVADAAVHVIHNPHGDLVLDRVLPAREWLRPWVNESWYLRIQSLFSRQVIITLALTVLSFGFWQLVQNGFTKRILKLAAVVIAFYLVVVGTVIFSGLAYLVKHPELFDTWWANVERASQAESFFKNPWTCVAMLTLLALWAFPQLALGLSGFELTMTIAPLVRGAVDDDPDEPRERVRNTRKLLATAVAVMSVLVLGSVLVTTLLVPTESLKSGGVAEDRALAYLAHGGVLVDGQPATALNGWFGDTFGTLYDVSTIIVLSLAGASVIGGLRGMLPHYLHRLGMALTWAGQTNVIMHLLNLIIMVVTLVFHASLAAQQWAYATSVLVLLAGAALAAAVDARQRRFRTVRGWLLFVPFAFSGAFFLAMTVLTALTHYSGLVIASTFVVTILVTSFISRWLRSTELRFDGFAFANEASRVRWQELCRRDFQIVAPHRPGRISLGEKNQAIRREYRISPDTPVLYVQVTLGDPSEFYQQPLVLIDHEEGFEVLRVAKCVSVSHVLASILLAFCHPDGRPPEVIFGWSSERPLAVNLNFLLLGEGNVPWMVKELIGHAEPNPERQPRILVG